MSEIHEFPEEKLAEFFTMVDWYYVKRVEITKLPDERISAKLVHYRSGRYMMHGLKHGWAV